MGTFILILILLLLAAIAFIFHSRRQLVAERKNNFDLKQRIKDYQVTVKEMKKAAEERKRKKEKIDNTPDTGLADMGNQLFMPKQPAKRRRTRKPADN